ncbi:MAG TPA: methyl-accepting chemotaxis protein [Caldisericia bacterium]|nr:methyl-accepting chemotaxis protein [Caldisericia bacterium]HPF49692.1 methyl-accepting chemotaxis protein [Caldisericia bacterium]HPI84535.1 methyl-accepting chemotaxis protein [Caldisericia bacterium]HPQ93650.1 methyl-accepting chemotaxis protein [Caldisericia bacterium]HRV74786.1 methyl-accepting chemotaxis protein [Caldisericia bacterium]
MADINNWWSRLTDFKRWRFSTKITFIVALISGIVLSLFFIGTQFYYNDTVENQMRDALLAQTKSVAEEIDHILGERIAVSAVRADSPVFSTVARTMSALSQQEKRSSYELSWNQQTYMSNTNEKLEYLKSWVSFLTSMKQHYGYKKGMFCDANGEIVVSSDPIKYYPRPDYKETPHTQTGDEPIADTDIIKSQNKETETLYNVSKTEWFKSVKESITNNPKGSVYDHITLSIEKDDKDGKTWSLVVSSPIVDPGNPGRPLGYFTLWYPWSKIGQTVSTIAAENTQMNGGVVYLPPGQLDSATQKLRSELEAEVEKPETIDIKKFVLPDDTQYEGILLHHSDPRIVGWSGGSIFYLRPDEYDADGKPAVQTDEKGIPDSKGTRWTTYHYVFMKEYALTYFPKINYYRELEASGTDKKGDISSLIQDTAFIYDVSGTGDPQLYTNYDVSYVGDHIAADKHLELFVYLRINRVAYTQPLTSGFLFMLGGWFLALIILILLVALFVQRQIRPLLSLRGGIMEVSFGNYDINVPIDTEDEIGDLAKTFNQMLSDIRSSIQTETERAQQDERISGLLNSISTVSTGDLTVQAEVTADILGGIADSLNYLVAQFGEILRRVVDVSTNIANDSQETLQATEQLSGGAQTQLELITDTSAAVDEMAISINQASQSADSAAQAAEHSAEIAETGGKTVGEAVEGMNKIRGSVAEISKRIKKLGESSQEIGEIVDVISDIAAQTNMLALNAAIEAARAGEQGRGFSVVADAVRQLAERSAKATKDIALLIRGIQAETAETVEVMEESTKLVVEGSKSAEDARARLDEIVSNSKQLAELIGSISLSSKQQSRATEEVNRSMDTISTITKETTEGILKSAEAVAKMASLAYELQEIVLRFKL